jgi:hypothetical protein
MAKTTEPDYDAEMRLPTGRTCDDCAHSRRCFALGFSKPGRASCDFWPNLFRTRGGDSGESAAQTEN